MYKKKQPVISDDPHCSHNLMNAAPAGTLTDTSFYVHRGGEGERRPPFMVPCLCFSRYGTAV